MLIIRIKSYYQNKSEISVCLTYSKLAKTAYKSVGGLYSCSDIFDFEFSLLGCYYLAKNIVNKSECFFKIS